MSMVVQCPKCGEPMDVPAYPGDGVYREHTCVEGIMARIGWALLWSSVAVMALALAGVIP